MGLGLQERRMYQLDLQDSSQAGSADLNARLVVCHMDKPQALRVLSDELRWAQVSWDVFQWTEMGFD